MKDNKFQIGYEDTVKVKRNTYSLLHDRKYSKLVLVHTEAVKILQTSN